MTLFFKQEDEEDKEEDEDSIPDEVAKGFRRR